MITSRDHGVMSTKGRRVLQGRRVYKYGCVRACTKGGRVYKDEWVCVQRGGACLVYISRGTN